jgi:NADH dehydrogenase
MEKVIGKISEKEEKKRIVIIGGGFAGLQMLKKLDNGKFQIFLLDRHNYHQFQPLYYQVATAGLEATSIGFSFRKYLRKSKNIHFRLCEVIRMNGADNCVETSVGTIKYDYLIIATGSYTNYFGKEELEKTTFSLKTISESISIRNQILRSLEEAVCTSDKQDLESILNFVIVGGGATGVELAGALSELRKYTLPRDYPELDIRKIKIYLLDGLDRLLSGMSVKASEKTARYLKGMGVEILLNSRVIDYFDGKVMLSNGMEIPSRNVFWVAGVKANGLRGVDPAAYGKANRLIVDEYNRVKTYSNVYAIGDTCIMQVAGYPDGHPQVAQVAIQQGRTLGENLNRLENGEELKPFVYKDKGSLATIGKNKAIAEIGSFKFAGFTAWIIWAFIHLTAIVGVKNKLFIFLNWVWNYFTHDASLRLLINPKNRNCP